MWTARKGMTNVKIYINNSRDIYCITDWLATCVAKRMKRGQLVTVEHLANCSTMKKIISMACKMCKEYNEPQPTKEERKEIATMHARYIIEEFAPFVEL